MADSIYTARYWKKRTNEAFISWVDEQPVTWVVTTFSCYKKSFNHKKSFDADMREIEMIQENSRFKKIHVKPVDGFINEAMKPTSHELLDEWSQSKCKRSPCTIKDMKNGFGRTVKAIDRKYLKNSQKKKGVKLLRVPYLGGDRKNEVPYHIHSLIELPQGVPIEEFKAFLNKLFQYEMERELKSHGRFAVETSVWCEHYKKDSEKFLTYCGRFEGATLAVGLEKVVSPHLIMNPPLVRVV